MVETAAETEMTPGAYIIELSAFDAVGIIITAV
jgi:hypothetical protein